VKCGEWGFAATGRPSLPKPQDDKQEGARTDDERAIPDALR
jgi:hypothetical protein